MSFPFTASIVLYRNEIAVAERAVQSVLATPGLETLYLVDNSGNDDLRVLGTGPNVAYIRSEVNLGFGRGHNRALERVSGVEYHAVINPDVEFGPTVIPKLIDTLRAGSRVGLVGPRLLKGNGHVEHSCRDWPRPFDLVIRRLLPSIRHRPSRFVLAELPLDRPSQVPILSGAFLVASVAALHAVGGFDERYFLYMEDYDLCRALYEIGYRCIYDPSEVVIHHYGGHSYRRLRPLAWHIASAIKYFNKWGWRPLF